MFEKISKETKGTPLESTMNYGANYGILLVGNIRVTVYNKATCKNLWNQLSTYQKGLPERLASKVKDVHLE